MVVTSVGAQTVVEKVQVGQQMKTAYGTVASVEAGDIGCTLSFRDDRAAAFKEIATFEVCQQGKALVNHRFALTYEMRRLQSPECQGEGSCKKTVMVAVITQVQPADDAASASAPAPAAAPASVPQGMTAKQRFPSLCTPAETIVFSCSRGDKMVSVCASSDAAAQRGYLDYRSGSSKALSVELTLPLQKSLPSKAATGSSDGFAGGGGAWLRFARGPSSIAVYSAIGKWGPKGETVDKAGWVLERDGKPAEQARCAGKYWSDIGPDLFDKLGIVNGGQHFDYPD